MNPIKIDESFLRSVFADVNDEMVLAALFGSPYQSQKDNSQSENTEVLIDHASHLKVNDKIIWRNNFGTEYISIIKEFNHVNEIDRWHLKLNNTGWIPWQNMNSVRKIINTTSQQTMKTNLPTKTDYIIGSVTENGDYSFSTIPKSHATPQSANAEVKRLARTIPGKQFVVFERKLTPVKTAIQTQQSSEWL